MTSSSPAFTPERISTVSRSVGKGTDGIYDKAPKTDAGRRVVELDDHLVDVHMANLRRKLGDDASSPRFVETVRGVGYRLREAD